MPFDKALPQWNKTGTTPTQTKMDAGWSAQEHPPASIFNWFFNSVYLALQELQQEAINTDQKAANNGIATLDATGDVPLTQGDNILNWVTTSGVAADSSKLGGIAAGSFARTDVANTFAGKVTGNAGFGGLGKVPAFTWSGSLPTQTQVTITHNLGYKPFVEKNGTIGNVIVTHQHVDNNSLIVYSYSGGSVTWNGTVYLY